MFLNNRRRHHEVISLLTTTVLSLSLGSLVCYQTNSTSCATPSGSRDTRTRRLGNVSGWWTSFRRTIFVVQKKILYCGPTITHKVSFWRLKWSQLLRKFVSQNKAKNAGRSRKNAGMREIHQNAGFPARLRDGWHLCKCSTWSGCEKSRLINARTPIAGFYPYNFIYPGLTINGQIIR